MKLLKLIPAAAIALTALLPFEVKANNFPNGWKQVGKKCTKNSKDYYKLQKKSDSSLYGWVEYFDDTSWWMDKDITLVDVNINMNNINMNNKCGGNSYQPTS